MSWSSAISAGASLIGGSLANSSNQDINAASLAFTRESMQKKYQWQVADLKKAGLNPMLAYMNPATAASTPSQIAMQDVVSPAVNSANSAKLMDAQIDNLEASKAQALATAENQQAQTRVNTANAIAQEGSNMFTYGNPLIDGAVGYAGKDLQPAYPDNLAWRNFNNKLNEMDLTRAQADYQREVINEIKPRIDNLISDGKLKEANVILSNTNAQLNRLSMPKIQAEADLYKALPNLLGSLPFIGSAINSAKGADSILRRR